ncbi:MAG TPA: DUF4402 domain-containing protein [Bacteroidales bacterium]|jgi:hypothetical protein|nr:DUF4402 domain-containing protein [Bacteroidales bacterium]
MKLIQHIPVLTAVLFLGASLKPLRAIDPDPEVTGKVVAELADALSASETSPLSFGRFFIDGEGGGTIIIEAASSVVRTSTGSSVHLASGGNPGPAIYEVLGLPNYNVTITLPGESTLTHSTNPAHRMTVDNWEVYPSHTGRLDVNGQMTFYMGAVLRVQNLSQNPVGVYSGTYAVTFDYN